LRRNLVIGENRGFTTAHEKRGEKGISEPNRRAAGLMKKETRISKGKRNIKRQQHIAETVKQGNLGRGHPYEK